MNTLKYIVSGILTCFVLIGCSDPASTQKTSSSEPSFTLSPNEAEPHFDQPEQVASSLQFKIISTVTAEETVTKLESLNYQVRIK